MSLCYEHEMSRGRRKDKIREREREYKYVHIFEREITAQKDYSLHFFIKRHTHNDNISNIRLHPIRLYHQLLCVLEPINSG